MLKRLIKKSKRVSKDYENYYVGLSRENYICPLNDGYYI